MSYNYQFPLPEVAGAPVPSTADYSSQNCAWLIEFFAHVLSVSFNEPFSHMDVSLKYENNTPGDTTDDITVVHPNDKFYLPEEGRCRDKSRELLRYEAAAKKSQRLKDFEKESPAGIKYFDDMCPVTRETSVFIF